MCALVLLHFAPVPLAGWSFVRSKRGSYFRRCLAEINPPICLLALPNHAAFLRQGEHLFRRRWRKYANAGGSRSGRTGCDASSGAPRKLVLEVGSSLNPSWECFQLQTCTPFAKSKLLKRIPSAPCLLEATSSTFRIACAPHSLPRKARG